MYGIVDLWISPLLTSMSSHFLMIMSSGWENGLFFCDRCYGTGHSTSHGLHSLTSNIHLQSHIQLRVAFMTHRSL